MRFLAFVGVVCCLFSTLAAQDDRAVRVESTKPKEIGKSMAILVGVQDYDRVSPLKYCRNDVHLLAATLRENCKFDTVIALTEDAEDKRFRPTKGNIISELDLWLKVANEGGYRRVLLYFSGHGFRDDKDRLYFAPPDCHAKQLQLTALPMSYVKQTLDGCANVPVKLLILDTCHSGETKGDGEGITGDEIATTFANARGLYTIASCAGDEVSLEWNAKRQGVFTYWLCQGLKGEADRDSDGAVDTGELYKYVFSRVLKTSAELGRAQNVVARPSSDWRGVALLSHVTREALRPDLPELSPLATVTLFNGSASEGAKLYIRYGKGSATSLVIDRGRSQQITFEANAGFWYYSGDPSRGQSGWVNHLTSSADDLEFHIDKSGGKTTWRPHPVLRDRVGAKLVRIEAGRFIMGSRDAAATLARLYNEDQANFADEQPRHRVSITRPFYIGATEVTRGQFRQFVEATDYRTDAERDGRGGTGFNPNAGKTLDDNPQATSWRNPGHKPYDDSHPVVLVSWNDAKAYCNWLSRVEGARYRLPTEAEWEYAARAGTNTRYWTGNDVETLATGGNGPDATFREYNVRKRTDLGYATLRARDGWVHTAPAANFRPNAFGLYDVHGNVWEWCEDNYDAAAYRRQLAENPLVVNRTDLYVIRGGCYM